MHSFLSHSESSRSQQLSHRAGVATAAASIISSIRSRLLSVDILDRRRFAEA
ncbi:MAG: hypothetical protein OJF51_004697 [Nitrospira sp.]|nr:MAG: hypothetical protein OJF51_004697 [Nitrospira sp.]